MKIKIESTTYPLFSGYHPSVLILVSLLKDSFKVKRQIEGAGGGNLLPIDDIFADFDDQMGFKDFNAPTEDKNNSLELIIDYDRIESRTLTYLFYMKTPALGLHSILKPDNKLQIRRLAFQYLEQCLIYYIELDDWRDYFKLLYSEIKSLLGHSNLNERETIGFLKEILRHLNTPKLRVSWYIALEDSQKAISLMDAFSSEIQNLSLYIIKSNNFELKPKSVWISTLKYVEELSECLLLIEERVEDSILLDKQNRNSLIYSLIASSQISDGYGLLKDHTDINGANFNEQSSVIIMQICYSLFLVSINLGMWDVSCDIIRQMRSYLSIVRENRIYASWKLFHFSIVIENVASIYKKLDSYPEFYYIAPSHYNDDNILRQVFEGIRVKCIDCELFPELPNYSKILLRTLFRWYFNNECKNIFESFFKLESKLRFISSYQTQGIASLRSFVSEYSLYLKNDFFHILSLFDILRQIQILKEIKQLIGIDAFEKNGGYGHFEILNPLDIHFDKINCALSTELTPGKVIRQIEEVVYLRLFTIRNQDHDLMIEQEKKEVIEKGLEIVKMKEDSRSTILSPQFRSISILKDHFNIGIVIQTSKTIVEYDLFSCLFGKLRQNNGLRLLNEDINDGTFSGHFTQSSSITLDSEFISKMPISLKILYDCIYGDKERKDILNLKNMSWNQLSYVLFEDKETIGFNLNNVSCSETHPNFPIIFAGKKGSIQVVYSKTMASIGTLESGSRTISRIIVNYSGDRIIGIDSEGGFYIWNFNLLDTSIEPMIKIEDLHAIDACFISNSSRCLISTRKNLYLYDIFEELNTKKELKAKSKIEKLPGITKLLFLPFYNSVIVIIGKHSKICKYELTNKMKEGEIIIDESSEILSGVTNSLGTQFAVGLSDGRIFIYNSRSMEMMNEFRPFEREGDKKSHMAVSVMTIINDFVLAGSSGGIISIITRI